MNERHMLDHTGAPLVHDRARVNGVDLHFATAGTGEPVYLIHGAPKTMFIWRHIVPTLTPHFEVVVLDCRGYGSSGRPLDGYDTETMAADVISLADHLHHQRIRIAGEDWGAAIAYATAAFHRDRVAQLIYQEMRLPGIDNQPGATTLPKDDSRTGWHFAFFNVPHYPELLMPGHERAFWTSFVTRTMVDPSAATSDDLDAIVDWIERPGGLHTILSVYRAAELDAAQNRTQFSIPLEIPVLAVGGAGYLADEPRAHMAEIANDVTGIILERCGHNPSLEAPDRLAAAYLQFLT